MSISQGIFDKLREAGIEDSVISAIDKENQSLIKLEGDERMYNKLTKQLGDQKIEDLINAKKYLDEIGGVDGILGLKQKADGLEKDSKELSEIRSKFSAYEADTTQKFSELEKSLTNEKLKNTILPQLTGFNPKAQGKIVDELVNGGKVKFGETGSLLFVDGDKTVDFSTVGLEKVKENWDYAVVKPVQNGTIGDNPTSLQGGGGFHIPQNLFK